MSESMAEVGTSMQDQAANPHLPPPPPPPIQRRPRVREVSSRFMSPVVSSFSSSSSPLPNNKQRSSSVQKQRQTEPLSCADENRHIITDFIRSPPQRKHQHRAVMKLFKENGGSSRQDQPPSRSHFRPDTPTVTTTSSSKIRLMKQRSTPSTMSAAAKLLQSSGMSSSHLGISNLIESSPSPSPSPSSSPSRSACSGCDGHENCENHNIEGNHLSQSSSTQSLPDLRSSMPEAGVLPKVSGRFLADRSVNRPNGTTAESSKFSASPCSRSIDLPQSSTFEYSLMHSLKAAEKPGKQYTNSVRMGCGLPLPPVPHAKLAADFSRKGRKILSHQESVHSLRLLHNHYLQWRYANAKAEASIKSQRRETERTIYSLGVKISELYDSVERKRIELGLLQRAKTLYAILEAQMPYLEEWSTLEPDYSISLSEAMQALLNTSLRLPISGNVKADVREVGEALNSAMKLMELIAFQIQSFMPKAEEMDILISELASLSGGERALIEECGDLLYITRKSQVEECSLRGQLIQLNRIHGQHHG
ncbi:hypothetical protein P3X46_025138 [Hevea brasiliensis]|uniref:Protein ENDOSPERM DEFECTIVE 1 n=1 Tax=Hevea brasiliensis TaxID=3981 RepID=A0ABQ9L4K5_HEVBR|nr:protein ENDOSPERM DEFECTIVE 1 [Hevea brasiliensis]KAJ9159649.1 hypothetical protein P3X46_025138 [Hevea brasiliensis]